MNPIDPVAVVGLVVDIAGFDLVAGIAVVGFGLADYTVAGWTEFVHLGKIGPWKPKRKKHRIGLVVVDHCYHLGTAGYCSPGCFGS